MAFWKQTFRLALTTGCNVPAGGLTGTVVPNTGAVLSGTPQAGDQVATGEPVVTGTQSGGFAPTFSPTRTSDRVVVYRVGLASHILNAPVQEYNGRTIGQTHDIAIIVQTGGIIYVVVEPSSTAGQGTGVGN